MKALMLISKNQIEIFNLDLTDKFIQKIIAIFRQKFPGYKFFKSPDETLQNQFSLLFDFCVKNKFTTSNDIIYFFHLCCKYNMEAQFFYEEAEFIDIFSYPDRSVKDKLFNFHMSLKYKNKWEQDH